jgi:hypothetical protein
MSSSETGSVTIIGFAILKNLRMERKAAWIDTGFWLGPGPSETQQLVVALRWWNDGKDCKVVLKSSGDSEIVGNYMVCAMVSLCLRN